MGWRDVAQPQPAQIAENCPTGSLVYTANTRFLAGRKLVRGTPPRHPLHLGISARRIIRGDSDGLQCIIVYLLTRYISLNFLINA